MQLFVVLLHTSVFFFPLLILHPLRHPLASGNNVLDFLGSLLASDPKAPGRKSVCLFSNPSVT